MFSDCVRGGFIIHIWQPFTTMYEGTEIQNDIYFTIQAKNHYININTISILVPPKVMDVT